MVGAAKRVDPDTWHANALVRHDGLTKQHAKAVELYSDLKAERTGLGKKLDSLDGAAKQRRRQLIEKMATQQANVDDLAIAVDDAQTEVDAAAKARLMVAVNERRLERAKMATELTVTLKEISSVIGYLNTLCGKAADLSGKISDMTIWAGQTHSMGHGRNGVRFAIIRSLLQSGWKEFLTLTPAAASVGQPDAREMSLHERGQCIEADLQRAKVNGEK